MLPRLARDCVWRFLFAEAMGTRPGPLFWFGYQACFYRVFGYVGADSLELVVVATPVIVGFLLPERLSGASEDLIGGAGGYAL